MTSSGVISLPSFPIAENRLDSASMGLSNPVGPMHNIMTNMMTESNVPNPRMKYILCLLRATCVSPWPSMSNLSVGILSFFSSDIV